MSNIRHAVPFVVAIAAFACSREPTRPRIDPTACASTNGDPTVSCARIDARILYSNGRPAFAFVVLDDNSDTSRYRVSAPISDSTGQTIVEVRQRSPAAGNIADVRFLVATPPASSLGTFSCAVATAHLRFSALGAVPDTLRATWTLMTLTTAADQCASSPVSQTTNSHLNPL